MGLAASQARLLTITARKADCEFQSMALSHQKIALSRDMERISDEYQDAMNKTKLVYDYYGTGTSQMNLNYSLLMTPSVYNDYFPKFITDKQNRCVLSPEYAAAARAAGIPHEGYNGTPSSEVRNAFIEAICNNGVITPATAANIEAVPYNNAVGLGELYSGQSATMEITYDELLKLIEANCVDTANYGENGAFVTRWNFDPHSSYPEAAFITNYERDIDLPHAFRLFKFTDAQQGSAFENLTGNISGTSCRFNGTKASGVLDASKADTNPCPSSLTLSELLKGDEQGSNYIYQLTTRCGPRDPITETAFLQQTIVGNEYSPSFLNWMVDQFSTVLGGVQQNEMALQYAYDKIVDLIYPNEDVVNAAYAIEGTIVDENGYREGVAYRHYWDRGDTRDQSVRNQGLSVPAMDSVAVFGLDGSDSDVVNESAALFAGEYIGLAYCGRRGMENYREANASVAVDLSTLVKVFMTAFREYLEGAENSRYSYERGQKLSEASFYDPKDGDTFTILAPADVNNGTEDMVASFYDSMFNIICTNGWTENENIGNADYMQELLKSGAVYISTIDNDAYYYQSSYSTDTYIQEVQDTDAIAQAEAKYNAQKARIENKENTIDMKMKNLDTEISSLTTEYDTMKNVITKSIEKSFKRYDA